MTSSTRSVESPVAPGGTPKAQVAPAPEKGGRPVRNWKAIFALREMGVYYALVVLILVLAAVTAATGRPNYLSATNLTNILYQASLVSLMGMAMTVILITGNFDLSVASVAALAAAVLISVSDRIGFVPGMVVAMLAAMAVGVLNGAIVQYLGINAFIVTLGTLTAIRGAVLIVTNARSLSVEKPEVKAAMRAFEAGRVPVGVPVLIAGLVLVAAGVVVLVRARRRQVRLPVPGFGMLAGGLALAAVFLAAGPSLSVAKPVIYMMAVMLVVWFVLSFTTIGRRIYAVGGNAEAARLSGVNVRAYKMGAFVLCSGAAGLGGVLFGCRLGAINPTALQGAELTVIASAILGGTSLLGGAGSVLKTLAGALLLFTLTNGFNILNLGANYQGVIEGTVVVTAAAIYTVGGRSRARK
jgi:D-xylose transport system permease protein